MTITAFYQRAELNGGMDRAFGEWKIIDIHHIPETLSEQEEVDFYCCNDAEVYLLRIRNRKLKKLDIVSDQRGLGYPKYLIAELPILTIDNRVLQEILEECMDLND